MSRFDPTHPAPVSASTGATPDADALFADAPVVVVDNPMAPLTIATGDPAVFVLVGWSVYAESYSVVGGRVAPGQTVRIRATDVTAYPVVQRTKRRNTGPAPAGAAPAGAAPGGIVVATPPRPRAATTEERRALCWRVHCGGVWLPRPDTQHPLVVGPIGKVKDPRTQRMRDVEPQELPPVLDVIGDELTLALPTQLAGQTLVVIAHGPGQLMPPNRHFVIPVDGPHPAGQNVTTAAQIAAVMNRPLPSRGTKLTAEQDRFLTLCDWLIRLLPDAGLSPLQQAHFLAQIYLETGQMRLLVEGASGDNLTEAYRRGPPPRDDEGVPESNFRGRGLMQLTWAANYNAYFRAYARATTGTAARDYSRQELKDMAPRLEQPEHAVRSALWYWSRPGDNPSGPAAVDNVWGASIRVNGWHKPICIPNGYPPRVAASLRAKRLLGLLA